jgi:2-hydroxychromene-2-carboxylate isomerase
VRVQGPRIELEGARLWPVEEAEFRRALLADSVARGQSERLAEAFARADPERLSAALEAEDIVAFQRELGLTDAEFVEIATDLKQARQSALEQARGAMPAG